MSAQSYIFLTLLVALSIGPVRRDYYEIFYVSHIILVLGFMLSAWAHHPPLGGWMYASLLYWAAERITRAIKIAYVNGLGFAGRRPKVVIETRSEGHSVGQPNRGHFNQQSYNSSASKGGYARSRSSTLQTLKNPDPHSNSYRANELGYNYPPGSGNGGGWPKESSSSYSHSDRNTYDSHGNTSGSSQFSSPPPAFNSPLSFNPMRPDPNSLNPNEPSALHRVNTQFYEPLDDVLEGYMRERKSGVPSPSVSPGPQEINEDESITPTTTNPLPFSSNAHPLAPEKFELEDRGSTLQASKPTFNQSRGVAPTPRNASSGSEQIHSSADDYRNVGVKFGGINRPNNTSRPSTADSMGTMAGLIQNRRIPRPAMSADVAAVIRPGFAFVQLLPGKTLRLTLRTPNRMSWQPGQWVNLNLPSVRWWESHPFTIASAHDAEFPTSTRFEDDDEETGIDLESGEKKKMNKVKGEERTIVLLLRARKGFTAYLWEFTRKQRSLQLQAASEAGYDHATLLEGIAGPNSAAKGTKSVAGVHLRAIVDGPYGSSTRVKWGSHSTVMIVCGGSGVSFGMSLLEHLCACIAGKEAFGRSGKGGRGFETKKIRFVWMLREFSHLQWVASSIRRCIEMVPPEQLQVDLFVTHYNNQITDRQNIPQTPQTLAFINPQDGLLMPKAPFSNTPDGYISANSYDGASTPNGFSSPNPASSKKQRFTDGDEQEEYDLNVHDLTHFDGEDESAPTEAEEAINLRIRNEGKLRRAQTRKLTMKRKNKNGNEKSMRELMKDDQILESQRAVHEGAISFNPPPIHNPTHNPNFRNPTQNFNQMERDIGDESTGYLYGDAHRRDPSLPQTLHRKGSNGNQYFQPSHVDRSESSTPSSSRPSSPGNPFNSLPSTPLPESIFQSTSNLVSSNDRSYDSADYNSQPIQFSNPPNSKSKSRTRFPSSSSFNALKFSKNIDLEEDPGAKAPIDLDEQEDLDLRVVAELARPGHPKLDRILREEVERSQGKILVASCGPGSLATVLKSIVAKQVNPERVRKGDMRGMINIVTESYEVSLGRYERCSGCLI